MAAGSDQPTNYTVLDEPKVRVHYDRVRVQWTEEREQSGEGACSTLEWTHPTVLDGLRQMFQCPAGETIRVLEVSDHGISAFFMKLDGSPVPDAPEPKGKVRQPKPR